jgi:hypothetical protein
MPVTTTQENGLFCDRGIQEGYLTARPTQDVFRIRPNDNAIETSCTERSVLFGQRCEGVDHADHGPR